MAEAENINPQVPTGPTILVAEDDDFLSRVLIDKLEKEKFKVLAAKNGEEALEIMTKQTPDLVILDMIMPKKTGFDVIDTMKTNPTTQNIPVIILSNLGQESDIGHAKERGINDYFVKSNISLVAVIQKIHEKLGK